MSAAAVLVVVAVVFSATAAGAHRDTVTLKVWDTADQSSSPVYRAIYKRFEAAHPGVKIQVTSYPGGNFTTAFNAAMAAQRGPDIWWMDPAVPANNAVRHGLVLDLTPYYFKYHWNKKIPATLASRGTFDGKFYVVPDSVESIAVFYRKSTFKKLGVAVPRNWRGLEKVMSSAKAHGYVPFALGDKEKWPASSHWLSVMLAGGMGGKKVEQLMSDKASWNSSGVVGSLAAWQKLGKTGAFPKAVLSLNWDDAFTLFAQDKAAMYLAGSWVLGTDERKILDKKDVGIFLLPSWKAGIPTHGTQAAGNGWLINAHTSEPDLAAELVNYTLFNLRSQRDLYEKANDVVAATVPPKSLATFKVDSKLKQILELTRKAQPNVSFSYVLAVMPTQPGDIYDAANDDMQSLLQGKSRPADVAANWQKLWLKDRAAKTLIGSGGLPKR